MYFSAPIYAQRQYASNEGLYKIHAITKTKPGEKLGSRPLYDMLTQYVQPAPSGQPRSVNKRPDEQQRSNQEAAARQTSQSLRAANSAAAQSPHSEFVPSPLDRAARSKPYNPQGRFRELGFDAGYLPPQPLSPDKQQTRYARFTEMLSAYQPFARLGAVAAATAV